MRIVWNNSWELRKRNEILDILLIIESAIELDTPPIDHNFCPVAPQKCRHRRWKRLESLHNFVEKDKASTMIL